MLQNILYLMKATAVTIQLALAAIALSTAIGLVCGLASHLGGRPSRTLIQAYVFAVRGTPLLVQMFLVYFGLPFFGIHVSPYVVAILAISIYMGALTTEILRGSIAAISQTQMDAGRSIGLRDWQCYLMIILPQALRSALPPYISLLPTTIKTTALGSVISIWELTLASREVVMRTIDPFGIFGAAMAIYFILCYPITLIGTSVERRVTRYRF